jgi:hypothetical protein
MPRRVEDAPPARWRPLLRRLCLPFRHECVAKVGVMVPQRGSNAGLRLTKAVPCHWTIAAPVMVLAGGLEPPASRLRGECSAR